MTVRIENQECGIPPVVQTLGNLPTLIPRLILLPWCFLILYTIAAATFLSIKTYEIKSEASKAPQSGITFRQDCQEHPPPTQIPRLLKVKKLGLRVEHQNLFQTNYCKTVLEDVSTAFTPGKLSILLGPSGSGKTL
jgi:ABC-type transport system involved in cytochrome bd biosynthesis fused ATPase/permease subunit